MSKHIRRRGSLVDTLDRGVAIRNGATQPAPTPTWDEDSSASSAQNDNLTFYVKIETDTLEFRPRGGFYPDFVKPENLLSDLFDAAETEIVLLSNSLAEKIYGQDRILDDLLKAAERSVKIWIIVRQPCDWAWLDKHPIGKALAHFEENGVYIRTLPIDLPAELGCFDFAVIDRKYFRHEANGNELHAKAAYYEPISKRLIKYYLKLWCKYALNLTGPIAQSLIVVRKQQNSTSAVDAYFCEEFPGISFECESGTTEPEALKQRLQQLSALVMGGNYRRRHMIYEAEIKEDQISLMLKDKGEVAVSPEELKQGVPPV